jgi:hypothetical protein
MADLFRFADALGPLKLVRIWRPTVGLRAVVAADNIGDKERLIRAFATAIADVTDYIPGPDMGTDEMAMGWIRDETGRAVGLPRELSPESSGSPVPRSASAARRGWHGEAIRSSARTGSTSTFGQDRCDPWPRLAKSRRSISQVYRRVPCAGSVVIPLIALLLRHARKRRSLRIISSAIYEHGDLRVSEHLDSLAAEHDG